MKNILALIAILMGLLAPQAVNAECMACWELKGVVIELVSGEVLEGYVTWSDDWYDTSSESFPESLLKHQGERNYVWFMRHDVFRKIKYPFEALVTIDNGRAIYLSEIKGISHKAREHDGFEGAGSLPLLSEEVVDRLKKPPVASCHSTGDVSEDYWLSYDKAVGKNKIKCLCNPKGCSEAEVKKLRKNPNIISLMFGFD